ncbi:MAG: DUF1570 domain-containing protein [Planctomycetaceae bacterium]
MRVPKLLPICVFLFSVLLSSPARPEALLEMKIKDKAYQGKLVAYDNDVCWLMDRDGRLHRLEVRLVGEHKSVSPEFRRLSSGDVRDQLRREFSKEYEIAGTSHFLVCAAKGRAEGFAPIFEEIYRSFNRYLGTRGLKVQQPEFPLVAIVFADRLSFASYAKRDGVAAARGLVGYYHPASNRIALFDDSAGGKQVSMSDAPPIRLATLADVLDSGRRRNRSELEGISKPLSPQGRGWERGESIERCKAFAAFHPPPTPPWKGGEFSKPALDFPTALESVPWHGNIQANLEDTIVHETTHQVAFNTGLHSRIADNPRWVVEGIATVFESPGVRDAGGTTPQMRINRERFVWFGNFDKTRRKPKTLANFVSSDELFNTAPLDAYSQAWALTFFLIETRSAEYSRYMKVLRNHDPMKPYTPNERLSDFKHAFGNELDLLDAQLQRFIERLN